VSLFLLAGLGACAGDSEPVATSEISMSDAHAFEPSVATVESGVEITFTNDDDEPHTVTAYADSLPEGADYFSSGDFGSEQEARDGVGRALIAPGEEYTITLSEPGTYEYFCIPHEDHGMKGEIQI
jgi:plastocyanin